MGGSPAKRSASPRVPRAHRGLTQGQLASRAGITRQKVIQVEAGSETVGAAYYAKVAGAMGLELSLTPARKQTLDELRDMNLT